MRLVVMICFGVVALGAMAAAQTAPGVSVNWDALKPPPAAGASVDWSALDALSPAATDRSAAPAPAVVLVRPPKPVEPPPVAVPRKPVAPALVAISPPRPPMAPQAAAPPPGSSPVVPAAAPALLPGKIAMLRYAKGQSDLPADGRGTLDALAAQLAGNPKLRVQLVAYASGSGDDPIEARRLSLTRAVALRTYLIDKGVQSVRMDVRALGNRDVGDGPADRVDLVVVDR